MKRNTSWIAVLPSLVVPVCIGMSLYLGLQYLIDQETITDEMTLRYLTGHPVSKITVGMFFIGMASLAAIGWNVFQQYSSESQIRLDDLASDSDAESNAPNISKPSTSDAIAELAVDHGQAMLDLPDRLHSHYLWERLVKALHSIYRSGSTGSVEEELKYLADIDIERQQQRYSLVRILIWATPMLGFLGTVLGISQALGGIAVGPDNDFQQMMDGLRGSLYIAFDTTALALTLSMVMMFALFLVDRFESQLLRLVQQRASAEIARHFDLVAGAMDPETNRVVDAIYDVVSNQTEIWRESIRAAELAWTASLTQSNDLVRSNLTESLDENVAALAHYLGEAIEKADHSMSHRWSQWQVTLSENAREMQRHQTELAQQTDSIRTIVNGLEDSSTFKSALEQQQNAIQATTKTHDILHRLIQSTENSASMQAAAAAASAAAVSSLPVPDSTASETQTATAAFSASAEELQPLRIFGSELIELQFVTDEPPPESAETAVKNKVAAEGASEPQPELTVTPDSAAEVVGVEPVLENVDSPAILPFAAKADTIDERVSTTAAEIKTVNNETVDDETVDNEMPEPKPKPVEPAIKFVANPQSPAVTENSEIVFSDRFDRSARRSKTRKGKRAA